MTVSIDVKGVPEMLRTLGKIDPQLRKEAAGRFRSIGAQLRTEARAEIPIQALSGWRESATARPARGPGLWARGRLKWTAADVRKGIKARFRTSKHPNLIPLVWLQQTSPAGSVYEIAGRRSASGMAARISSRHGTPSRAVWRVVDRNRATIETAVAASVSAMMETIDREAR